MGFRARWTEEQFEEWFHARFEQWINDRFGERLQAELDRRMPVWADRVDSRFREAFDAQFDPRFNNRINVWQDSELKKGFDAWLDHAFDDLFTVWANTWADETGFQERFDKRFDERFTTLFQERVDTLVTARVANEIESHIDRRIEAWLVAVRQDLVDAAPTAADQTEDPSPRAPAGEPATATAVQLARYLSKGPLQPQRIRAILKGKELPGKRPNVYPLEEAAITLLLRRGRQAKAADQAAISRDDSDAQPGDGAH